MAVIRRRRDKKRDARVLLHGLAVWAVCMSDLSEVESSCVSVFGTSEDAIESASPFWTFVHDDSQSVNFAKSRK